MIRRRGVLAGGLAALAAGCGRGADLSRLAAGESGKVAQVRSGEVLFLEDGLEVRLAGVEASNGAEPLAAEARAALSDLALGQAVVLRYGGLRRDRYERALAHVVAGRGRRWLQGEMLKRGLARVRTYSDNRALAAEMLELEAQARRGGLGLWAHPDYGVLLPAECAGRSGFQIVEGRVQAVRNTPQAASLDLVGGCAVDVPAFALEAFAAAGREPAALTGRLVRARGTLRSRRLRLDHPEALEVLREG